MFLSVVLVGLLYTPIVSFHVPNHNHKSYNIQYSSKEWQNNLDEFLDIDTSRESRRELASKLFKSLNEIRQDVRQAIKAKDVELIAPKTLKYGKAVEGLKAFKRQVISDIIPDLLTNTLPNLLDREKGLLSPAIIESNLKELKEEVPKQLENALNTLKDISQDASKLQTTVTEARQEVRNIFRSTPEGLQTPAYTVLKKIDTNFEIRRYEPYSVCVTDMASSSLSPTVSGGSFRTLAKYLFGSNQASQPMAMTTPVIIENQRMEFVLPEGLTKGLVYPTVIITDSYESHIIHYIFIVVCADSAPLPTTENIKLEDRPGQTVAALEFAGTLFIIMMI